MKKAESIPNSSGMSKLDDARKHCPSPIKGSGFQATLQKVSGAGSSKPGAPTLNARSKQPKAVAGTGFEVPMTGKKKK